MKPIPPVLRGIAAWLAAVLVQPLITLPAMVWFGALRQIESEVIVALVAIAAMMVASLVVGVLGLPAFLLLRRLGWASKWSAGLLGFGMAALVGAFGFSGWPRRGGNYSYSATWHGQAVDIYVNGEPTRYAWFQFAESLTIFGLHGLAGALAFYATWRWCERRSSP